MPQGHESEYERCGDAYVLGAAEWDINVPAAR